MDLELDGKVAIVTGSSRGLGFGSALALVQEGCRVTICARDESRLLEAADALRTAAGKDDRVLAVRADLATAEASGGIRQRHRDYLPAILLMAEYCAVADDTIDRAPTRSGRVTFAAKFGDASAVPFACALATLVLAESHHDEPEARDHVHPALSSAEGGDEIGGSGRNAQDGLDAGRRLGLLYDDDSIVVVDVGAIRQRLAGLGLGWE